MVMKIRHSELVHSEITLSDDQVDEITLARLRMMVHPAQYLRTKSDGSVWLTRDDPHWRHGSISEEDVRPASKEDIIVFKVIDLLWTSKSLANKKS
jgi:hypothetical protein